MARRNISLPDDLDEQARAARLNVSAIAQRAVAQELDRQSRMAALDAWLDELDAAHGAPSTEAMAEARQWMSSVCHPEPRRSARRATPSKGRKARRAAG